MRKRIMFTLLALLFWWNGAEAQSFDDYFIDKTLRVDYKLEIGRASCRERV